MNTPVTSTIPQNPRPRAIPDRLSTRMSYGPILWLLTVLLFLRVIGQLIVYFTAPRWLPPMAQWQSGLVPYPLLVAVQAIVLALMVSISIDFSRGEGYWTEPHPWIGGAAYWFPHPGGAATAALLLDYEQVNFHDYPAAVRPATQKRIAVHGLINF